MVYFGKELFYKRISTPLLLFDNFHITCLFYTQLSILVFSFNLIIGQLTSDKLLKNMENWVVPLKEFEL